MLVVEVLLVVVVVAVAMAVALGWGDRMVDVPVDRAPAGFPPEREITADAVPALRFNLALRGYRMAEVDDALAQLADALARSERRIAELEADGEAGSVGEGAPAVEPAAAVAGDG